MQMVWVCVNEWGPCMCLGRLRTISTHHGIFGNSTMRFDGTLAVLQSLLVQWHALLSPLCSTLWITK